jgi:hypothetical protein
METKKCVSCRVEIKDKFMYCYQCFQGFDQLNNCTGITSNKTKCQLKCKGHGCIYHYRKIQPPTYAEITKNKNL